VVLPVPAAVADRHRRVAGAGARGGYGPVIAKALVLLAAIVWLLVRRTLTRVEWVVLIALVPAFIWPRRPGWRGRMPTTRSSSRWSP
jgi:hypothetical protein